jgi:threonine/homoserine/homoserine lactone efflux protein
MLDLNWPTLWAVMVFAMVTSITPGPNNTMLLASGVNFGWVRTLPHLLGVSGGLLLILLLGTLGIQQWLFQMHWLRELIKWLGAVYLGVLAWRLFQAHASTTAGRLSPAQPMSFLQAALFQWANPKVWAMVFGFFSTYVPAQLGWIEAAALCTVFALVNLPCVAIWAITGDRLHLWLHQGQRLRGFNRSMGLLLLFSVGATLWAE